jgi:hypothetical protein
MALTPRYRGGQTAPEPARLAGAFRRRSPGLPSRPGRRQSVKLLATLIEMYGAAPEFAQQNPSHSASDDGPNGGRACPRHPVAQHLDRDKHNECDYGGDSSKANFFPTRSNTVRSNRQKFALLISKGNFDDPRFARFQRRSASIGRFPASQPAHTCSLGRAPAGLGLPPKPHIRRVESTRRSEQ